MAQLIALGLVAALVWYAWNALKRQMNQVGEKVREAEHEKAATSIESLEPGEDGVYRPKASRSERQGEGEGS